MYIFYNVLYTHTCSIPYEYASILTSSQDIFASAGPSRSTIVPTFVKVVGKFTYLLEGTEVDQFYQMVFRGDEHAISIRCNRN